MNTENQIFLIVSLVLTVINIVAYDFLSKNHKR